MLNDILVALGLLMVIEGFFPSLNPGKFRRTLHTISELENGVIRTVGLLSMAAGATLIYFVSHQ